MHKALWFSARIVAVAGILLISMFALDAFGTGAPLGQELVGFVIHLVPSFVLVVLLALAWKFERIGGLGFILISLLPFVVFRNTFWVNAMLGGPFFVSGVLFLLSDRTRGRGP